MATGTRKRRNNRSLIRKQTRAAQIAEAERQNPETTANRAFKERARQIRNRELKSIRKRQLSEFINERMNALIRIRIEMIDFNERGGNISYKRRLSNLYEQYAGEIDEAQMQLNSII